MLVDLMSVFFSFTLHPAHSKVGRGSLLLRYYVPHFPPILGNIASKVLSDATQRRVFTSTPKRKNENINLDIFFIPWSGHRTHDQSRLQSHTCAIL